MKIGIFNYYKSLNENGNIFLKESYKIGDGLEKPYVELKNVAKKLGHFLDSFNETNYLDFDIYIFFDFPDHSIELLKKIHSLSRKMYLVILESEIILPENWKVSNHKYFTKVFSWNSNFNKKHGYIDLQLSQNFNFECEYKPIENKKFACMIAGNKFSKKRNELYSLRRKIIRWYEKNSSFDFDLYGFGWDRTDYYFSERIRKYLPFSKIFKKKSYPSFRGQVQEKRKKLTEYQFNFCFENVSEITGYITEKIFDALIAGCIPIYLGAPDVNKYIPSNCFIDFSKFKNIFDLHIFLKNMTTSEKEKIVNNGKDFIESKASKIFSTNVFSETILKEIL